ncbi:MAG: PorV/PorQ family protein, partial [Candidatus Marinimicrobia bacterium]|nr:PorV/PorQ family protein [Candidatus Neomarinimicrobiota bacterium]
MSIKKSIIITLISISGLIGMTKTGTSAAQFLKIGPMAGIMGTGESGVANVRDLSAIHYNPAGLSRYRTQSVTFTQSNWLVNTNYYYFAGSMDFSNAGVVGFHITTLDYGDMLVRTVEEPDGTGEYFGSQDLSIGLAYSKNLTDRFSIGGQVKYISQEIWHMSAATAAIDLGALFITQFNGIRLGMSITNFGGKMMLSGRDVQFYNDPATELYGNNDQIPAEYKLNQWPLPLTFRVGLSGEAFDSRRFRLSWNVDAVHPSDNTEYLNVGSELEFNRMFYLRTGIRTLFVKNREGGAAFGGGI